MDGGLIKWKEAGFDTINVPVPFVHLFFHKETFTCTFVIVDEETKVCAIIDPVLDYNPSSGQVSSNSADALLTFIKENELVVSRILESHVHADHITAAAYLQSKLAGKPPICIGQGIVAVQETVKNVYNY